MWKPACDGVTMLFALCLLYVEEALGLGARMLFMKKVRAPLAPRLYPAAACC